MCDLKRENQMNFCQVVFWFFACHLFHALFPKGRKHYLYHVINTFMTWVYFWALYFVLLIFVILHISGSIVLIFLA